MSIKWTRNAVWGEYNGTGIKTYTIGGARSAWWAIMDSTLYGVRMSLGWAPTLTMSKRQCQTMDDYYAKKQEKP